MILQLVLVLFIHHKHQVITMAGFLTASSTCSPLCMTMKTNKTLSAVRCLTRLRAALQQLPRMPYRVATQSRDHRRTGVADSCLLRPGTQTYCFLSMLWRWRVLLLLLLVLLHPLACSCVCSGHPNHRLRLLHLCLLMLLWQQVLRELQPWFFCCYCRRLIFGFPPCVLFHQLCVLQYASVAGC